MPATLTIRDESTSGKTLQEFALEVLTERITVRELIRSVLQQPTILTCQCLILG